MKTQSEVLYADAVALADRGRWQAARERCLAVLAEDPDDPLARSVLVRADAELGRMSFADAEGAVRALSWEHPDLKVLRMRAARLVFRQGDRMEALRQARAILAEDQDDPAAHELVASLSCCQDDVTESLLHYKMALDLGDLARPMSRLTALVQARRLHEPASTRARILAQASPSERLAIRIAASRAAICGILMLVSLGWLLAAYGHPWLGASTEVVASLLFGVLTWCCLYICWNAGQLGRLRNRVVRAWVVFALAWGAVELLPEVVVLAALAIGVWIELALTARKHRSSAAGGGSRSSS